MKKLLTVTLAIIFISILFSQKKSEQVSGISGVPSSTRLNCNNISTWIYNNGFSDITTNGDCGFIFPKSSGHTAVFTSGLLWGAKYGSETKARVGGTVYRTGLQPGRILNNNLPLSQLTAEDQNLDNVRIFRIRSDVFPGGPNADLSSEIADGEGDYNFIRAQYEKDWFQWPAAYGAPFVDKNSNGTYEANIDVPGIDGALQTIWYVANDLDSNKTSLLYGTQPLGIELQVTIWGYNNPLLDNVLFKKYKIINKSNTAFNDMFVSLFSDTDLGDPTDDNAGCDTTLNIGFAFNGKQKDAVYGNLPPAVGFDLLNIRMTAFYCFGVREGPLSIDPTQGVPDGAVQFYNFMQGKYGLTGEYFLNKLTNERTTYYFPGDPVTGNGWADGQFNPPSDRRFGLSSGSFQLAPGNIKEIVVAEFAAMGSNRLNSVTELKKQDKFIQSFYDSGFDINYLLPYPPIVEVHGTYNNNIELTWKPSAESFSEKNFEFQGYNVYQLPGEYPFKETGKKIATFDKIDGVKTIVKGVDTLQTGNDTGIKEKITINFDALENYNLVRGKAYYFAVTAYTYNPVSSISPSTESSLKVVKVLFQDTLSGLKYGNSISVVHSTGNGNVNVTPVVYDPSILTGHNYKVYFTKSIKDSVEWNLMNFTTGEVLLEHQRNFSLNDNYPIIHGFYLRVEGLHPGVKKGDIYSTSDSSQWGWNIWSGKRNITWEGAGFNLEGFHGAIGAYSYYYALLPDVKPKKVLLKFARVPDGTISFENPGIDPNDPNVSYAYRYGNYFYMPVANPLFSKYIINKGIGETFQDFTKSVPLSAWDISDINNPRRLEVGFTEFNTAKGLVDGRYFPADSGSGSYDWLYIFNSDYSETANPDYKKEVVNNPPPIMYLLRVKRVAASPFSPGASGEDQFVIYPADSVSPADEFTFNSLDILTSIKNENLVNSYTLYQNYPNPFNPVTTIAYSIPQSGFVQLNVYNLLGQKVKELVNGEKEQGKHQVQFNAVNLATGVYFYEIRAGNFREVKKLILLK